MVLTNGRAAACHERKQQHKMRTIHKTCRKNYGQNKRMYDLQLKGSGPTAFSRGGDGKAAIKPVLREYLIAEFMHAMGIPTTRMLAVVSTGERVFRETLLPGAVITRVARSHIRVGTFEYFAAKSYLVSGRKLTEFIN